MTDSGVEDVVSNPVKLGFVVSDIRVVSNKIFVEKYPDVKISKIENNSERKKDKGKRWLAEARKAAE